MSFWYFLLSSLSSSSFQDYAWYFHAADFLSSLMMLWYDYCLFIFLALLWYLFFTLTDAYFHYAYYFDDIIDIYWCVVLSSLMPALIASFSPDARQAMSDDIAADIFCHCHCHYFTTIFRHDRYRLMTLPWPSLFWFICRFQPPLRRHADGDMSDCWHTLRCFDAAIYCLSDISYDVIAAFFRRFLPRFFFMIFISSSDIFFFILFHFIFFIYFLRHAAAICWCFIWFLRFSLRLRFLQIFRRLPLRYAELIAEADYADDTADFSRWLLLLYFRR